MVQAGLLIMLVLGQDMVIERNCQIIPFSSSDVFIHDYGIDLLRPM